MLLGTLSQPAMAPTGGGGENPAAINFCLVVSDIQTLLRFSRCGDRPETSLVTSGTKHLLLRRRGMCVAPVTIVVCKT